MVGPGGALQAASVVAMDKTSDVALVNVPEDLPVAPFADDTGLEQRRRRPGPHLRAGRRPRRRAALHAGCGHRRRRRHRRRARRHHALHHLVAGHAGRHGRRAAARRARVGARHPLRPRPGHVPRHLPPERPRRGRGRRPPVPEPGGARLARGAGHRRPRRRRRQGGPGAVRRAGRRPPAGGPADHGGERHPGAHHGRAAGPALRPAPGSADHALGRSSPPAPRSWTSPWARPPSMRG